MEGLVIGTKGSMVTAFAVEVVPVLRIFASVVSSPGKSGAPTGQSPEFSPGRVMDKQATTDAHHACLPWRGSRVDILWPHRMRNRTYGWSSVTRSSDPISWRMNDIYRRINVTSNPGKQVREFSWLLAKDRAND